MLGVWQPASNSSVVRLYHDGQSGGPLSYETNFDPESSINVFGRPPVTSTLLIHVITTGW